MSEWIACADQMPPPGVLVLVGTYGEYDDPPRWYYNLCAYEPLDYYPWQSREFSDEMERWTHWMPLPRAADRGTVK